MRSKDGKKMLYGRFKAKMNWGKVLAIWQVSSIIKEYWLLYFDGKTRANINGARVFLWSPEGYTLQYALKLDFLVGSVEASYEALIAGLRLAKDLSAKYLKVCGNSGTVVTQMNEGKRIEPLIRVRYKI